MSSAIDLKCADCGASMGLCELAYWVTPERRVCAECYMRFVNPPIYTAEQRARFVDKLMAEAGIKPEAGG